MLIKSFKYVLLSSLFIFGAISCGGKEDPVSPDPVVNPGKEGASLSIYPTKLDFGKVDKGSATERQITIVNNGSKDLNVEAMFLKEDGSPSFKLNKGPRLVKLKKGQRKVIYVEFFAEKAGDENTEFTIRTEIGTNKVPMTAKGIAPRPFRLSTNFLEFGPTDIKSQGTKKVFSVTNKSGNPVNVKSISIDGTDFVLENPAKTSEKIKNINDKFEFTVVFKPKTVKMGLTANLKIDIEGSGEQIVVLSGEGVAALKGAKIELITKVIDFGSVEIGVENDVKVLLIKNTGDTDLKIDLIEPELDANGVPTKSAFKPVLSTDNILGPGETSPASGGESFGFRYEPKTDGENVSKFVIYSNAINTPKLEVTLKGKTK